jgi:hypothetical protein
LVLEGHDVIRSEFKREINQSEERIKNELKQELGGKINQLEKVVRATANASYGLLTDVREDVKEVKGKLNEHMRQPAHAG